MPNQRLPTPGLYNPAHIAEVRRVLYGDVAATARTYAAELGLKPASQDQHRVGLLLIDCQLTFCHPDFELYVAGRSGTGAVDDMRRLVEFIYRNMNSITAIHATMDTHTAFQIFFDVFFVDAHGNHPPPMAADMSLAALERGDWRANPAAAAMLGISVEELQRHILHYASELSGSGKYNLTIWPYHAMLGGIGHALVPALEEAFFFHSQARGSQTAFEMKGGNPLTENYSVLRPEVLTTTGGAPIAQKSSGLINKLLEYDKLIIAGEAKSHCVAWTVDDLLTEINMRDPSLARKVYLLEDCSSAVVVPGIVDFTEQAEEAYARFADAGMNVVMTTDNIDWTYE